MTRVKITVIRRFNPKDVFGHEVTYPDGRVKPTCPIFKDGQEIIVENIYKSKPEEFCGWGWQDLFKDFSVIASGGNYPHFEPNVIYSCCRDGVRPVVFKLERIDE
ncbi:MAG: TIGR04076 family protein [Candidatus Kariarchaeaceae archaeon]|jgi:uncharacterized repeat protein (TIGR04076 family)